MKARSFHWNVNEKIHRLNHQVKDSILRIHSFLGCDTTSHLLGLGKGKFFKADIKKWYDTIQQKEVICAEERILLTMIRPGTEFITGTSTGITSAIRNRNRNQALSPVPVPGSVQVL